MHGAAPMWRNGRRNGLKIPKSSISERCSPFQCDTVLRGRIGNFRPNHAIRERRVENRPF
jgi:hypothetical protein